MRNVNVCLKRSTKFDGLLWKCIDQSAKIYILFMWIGNAVVDLLCQPDASHKCERKRSLIPWVRHTKYGKFQHKIIQMTHSNTCKTSVQPHWMSVEMWNGKTKMKNAHYLDAANSINDVIRMTTGSKVLVEPAFFSPSSSSSASVDIIVFFRIFSWLLKWLFKWNSLAISNNFP